MSSTLSLTSSLCPAIYGQEMVKAGLVLGLFGGSQRYADLQVSVHACIHCCTTFVDFKNAVPIRGDPHVLVVGDPGLGKSQVSTFKRRCIKS